MGLVYHVSTEITILSASQFSLHPFPFLVGTIPHFGGLNPMYNPVFLSTWSCVFSVKWDFSGVMGYTYTVILIINNSYHQRFLGYTAVYSEHFLLLLSSFSTAFGQSNSIFQSSPPPLGFARNNRKPINESMRDEKWGNYYRSIVYH